MKIDNLNYFWQNISGGSLQRTQPHYSRARILTDPLTPLVVFFPWRPFKLLLSSSHGDLPSLASAYCCRALLALLRFCCAAIVRCALHVTLLCCLRFLMRLCAAALLCCLLATYAGHALLPAALLSNSLATLLFLVLPPRSCVDASAVCEFCCAHCFCCLLCCVLHAGLRVI